MEQPCRTEHTVSVGAVVVPDMGTEVVRYKYRLRPGTLAERAFIQEWHRC